LTRISLRWIAKTWTRKSWSGSKRKQTNNRNRNLTSQRRRNLTSWKSTRLRCAKTSWRQASVRSGPNVEMHILQRKCFAQNWGREDVRNPTASTSILLLTRLKRRQKGQLPTR
jgi:hypothetical protein